MNASYQHIIVMGVSGCGKSTLAQSLANSLAWQMIEGDAFHPPENVSKMASGIPLNDDDRAPWLHQLNHLLRATPHAVLACSALKASYRSMLREGIQEPLFVHCQGSFEQLLLRMQARAGHFMPSSLLRSQFDTLELPNSELELDLKWMAVSLKSTPENASAQVLKRCFST